MQQIRVTKRDGSLVPLDLSKFHKVVEEACRGLDNVSASEIEIKSQIQFFDKIKTTDIQETLIKAAADLISEDTPNYQYVAGRMINYHLRKEVFGQYEPLHIKTIVDRNVASGLYEPQLLNWYSEAEWDQINSYINHSRDDLLAYAGMEQFRGKYLVRKRAEKLLCETPQIAFMLIAATIFHNYSEKDRLKYVKDFYDAISTFVISLPTPIMAGVRTSTRQFSSCVLIESGDSLDSITEVASAIVHYVSKRAGLGINGGRLRAINSPIGDGSVTHTGVIPFWKLWDAAVNSCSQGGVRKGSATINYPWWHYEVEDLLVLKNNKGTPESRIRTLDYCVQLNRLVYERLIAGESISLFSPHDNPGLYESFFNDQETFKQLYEAAEKDKKIRRKTISAIDFFTSLIQERKDTGRIYIMNVDHANDHSSFNADTTPIKMTNLCVEITLPTNPLLTNQAENDPNPEISLCSLSAINWGKISTPEDFEKPCSLIVRALDEILSYQDYYHPAAYFSTISRRPLGVGITNFAFWLAKNDLKYSTIDSVGLKKIAEYAEAWSYYLIKASAELAVEKSACRLSNETKYSRGIVPIDTAKTDAFSLIPDYELVMPWESLREQLKANGIRNSTLMACMPTETSAQISNSTNGIEPPRALVSIKQSKEGVLKQVVPGISRYKKKYDLLWNQQSPEGYLKICAVLQIFIDQAISVNTSYNPTHYPDEQIPMSELLKHILMHYKYGGKTLYYNNTYDGAGELDIAKTIETSQEDCDSCKL